MIQRDGSPPDASTGFGTRAGQVPPMAPDEANRPVDAELRRIYLLFAVLGIAEASLIPFLPLVLRDRGLSPQVLGAVLAAMAAAAFALGPAWGYVADRFLGKERTLGCSLAGAAVTAAVLYWCDQLVAAAVVATLFWAFRAPSAAIADAMALERLGPSRRGAYGSVRLWLSGGWAVGALIWGAVLESVGLAASTLLYAGLVGLTVLYITVAIHPIEKFASPSYVGPPLTASSALPALLLFLTAIFLLNWGSNATWSFIGLRIEALGGGAFLVGLASGLGAASEVPAMASTRRLLRRMGSTSVFVIGCVLFLAVYLIWASSTSALVIAIARMIAGVGFGLTYVGSVVMIDELVPQHLQATGQGTAQAVALGLSPVFGSLGGGFIYGYLSPNAMFLVAGGFAALAAASAWLAASAGKGASQGRLPAISHHLRAGTGQRTS